MKARLPVPCPLQPGESLPGLFSRAVIYNNYGSLDSLSKWFGLDEPTRGFNHTMMRRLAMGKGDIAQLAAFTGHTEKQVNKAALRIGSPRPGHQHDEYLSIRRWRYCPVCIQQGISHQKAWLIPFVTACPEHGCELIDDCHKCGKPHAVSLPMLPYCGSCQAFPEIMPAHTHELECARKIHNLIGDKPELKALLDRLMAAWFLSTSEALRPHYRFSPQLQTVETMRKRVIQLWPAARKRTCLAAAILTQAEHLKHKWPLFPFISTMLVDRAETAGAVLPKPSCIEEKIELLQSDDPWWVPQQAAANAAGISGHIIQRVVDAKQVRSRLFSDIDEDGKRHKFRMVDLNDWHSRIQELFENATQIEDTAGLSNILMFPLNEVIRDVRKGKMSVFIKEGNTLSDLMVSFKETQIYARKQLKPKGTLTSSEAAETLDTYHAVVADLVGHGILKTKRKSKNHRMLITKRSVEAFNKEFILVGTLAKQCDLNSTNLAEKLAALGINPISCGSLVSIYRRADIDGVDLNAVKDIENYETRTGRKSTVDPNKVDNPRVKKLIELVTQHGGLMNFCRTFGYSPGTLSLILREKKSFGPLAARRMEIRCKLEPGTLEYIPN